MNDGGLRFTDACGAAPEFCARVEISRALVAGDIDGDGDEDLLVTNTQGRARLYRNQVPRRGGGVRVEAWDPRRDRPAEGAVVIAEVAGRRLRRTQSRGSSYLASNEPAVSFGLGEAPAVERFLVVWPDGLREEFPGAAAGAARLRLVRGEGRAR